MIRNAVWLQTDAVNMSVLQLKLQATLVQMPMITEFGTQMRLKYQVLCMMYAEQIQVAVN